jgi:uncharacterized protein YjbJ (UPF0337 family)
MAGVNGSPSLGVMRRWEASRCHRGPATAEPRTAEANTARLRGAKKMKSARRDRAEGTVDKIAGRVLEAFGKLTGNRSAGAKGKAARARGTGRSAKSRVKRR